jgi:hypothetical protein
MATSARGSAGPRLAAALPARARRAAMGAARRASPATYAHLLWRYRR